MVSCLEIALGTLGQGLRLALLRLRCASKLLGVLLRDNF